MFLHSGASLHGHEYSTRPPPARRNALLRSSFAAPINRASAYSSDTRYSSSPSGNPATHSLKRVRPISEYTPKPKPLEPVVRFQEPGENEPTPTRSDAVSGDEGSVDVSDSDMSTSASTRKRRRRAFRNNTTYALCQPPPKLGNKQRIIHIRPKLLLQLQQIPTGGRPRPIIDIYPSSAIANSAIAVSLLKRVPRLARIKRQLGIQDVMLVKSEDYNTAAESDSEADDDNIKKRDLVAILSPLSTQDKVEIVLTDGTVWVATPRISGTSCLYEFETTDSQGRKTIARWVRRQVATKSAPTTPTSTSPPSSTDYKFTFSIIDPAHRRHPIMATLKSASLEVQDTYTTVSQSSGRYPPTNPALGPSAPSSPDPRPMSPDVDEGPRERETLQVEEWQKNFIQVSAVYVVLRHGWFAHGMLGGIASSCTTATTTPQIAPVARSQSFSNSVDSSSKPTSADSANRKANPSASGYPTSTPGFLPRRATSTGASFMRRATRKSTSSTASERPGSSELDSVEERKTRRPLSGDWNGSMANRIRDNSLVRMVTSDRESKCVKHGSEPSTSPQSTKPGMAITSGRRAVSEYFPQNPLSEGFENETFPRRDLAPNSLNIFPHEGVGSVDYEEKHVKHHRWRSVTSWFNKLKTH